jgi:predicted phosphodiesterase
MSGFLLTADTHLSDSKLAEYRWDLFRFLRETATRYDTSSIVIAGDLVDKKDRHPASFVNRLVRSIQDLVEADLELVVMKGNHDYADPTCPFFGFLDGFKDAVRYVDSPQVMEIGGLRCLLIPHDRAGIVCKTQPRGGGSYDVVLCHQTFQGVEVNGRALPGLYADRLGSEMVGTAQVFSGDIHVPQKVGNIQYIGSPYHIAFGDTYQGRILSVDSEGFTPIEYLSAPKKHTLVIRASEIESDWMADVYEGDFVRVRLVLTPAEALDATELRERVRAKLKGVISCGVLLDIEAPRAARKRLFSSEESSWDDSSVFDRYCKDRKIDSALIQVAKDCYGL